MARTTLVIPDALWREVKQRAAKENRTISEWVAEAISGKLKSSKKSNAPNYKFEWLAKPMGLKMEPNREAIYNLPEEAGRSWR